MANIEENAGVESEGELHVRLKGVGVFLIEIHVYQGIIHRYFAPSQGLPDLYTAFMIIEYFHRGVALISFS